MHQLIGDINKLPVIKFRDVKNYLRMNMIKQIIILIFCAISFLNAKSQTVSELHKKVKELNCNLPLEISLDYKILAIDSTDYEAILGMGNAYYRRWDILGNTDQIYLDSALIQMNKACSLKNKDYRANKYRGELFYEFGKFDLAYSDFNKALELNPKIFKIRWQRAKINMGYGKIDEAIEDLSEAITEKPLQDWLYRLRANCYARNSEFEKCKKDITKALKINKNENDNYLILGDYYALTQNYNKALKNYNYIINRNSSYSLAFLKRGNVYNKIGETEKAKKDWKIASQRGYILDGETESIFFGADKVKMKK